MPALPPEIGPYRVVRPLGQGGMGTVLLAEDQRLGRLVALKLFTGADARTAYARDQLLDEARAAAALSHPNIAAVHDVLDVDGQVAIVFEYVEGETLASTIARGPLAVDAALAIAVQLAEALTAAHEHGIVHRDLKPANVIVDRRGRAKVLDFGVARVLPRQPGGDAAAPTTKTFFVGTVGYAAPEQCLGQPADARADVFSFGVVLFEMLTGRRPYPGMDATTVVRAMLQMDPPHPAAVVPALPAPLDRLIASTLARDPDSRPQTARQLRDTLVYLTPADRLPARAEPSSRRWGAAAMLAAALGTGVLVSSVLTSRSGPTVSAVEAATPVVAVMPLVSASGDEGRDYLAVGLAESLTTRLAAVPSITVLSRAAVLGALADGVDLPSLAAELDATYLVTGSVQQIGDRVQINLSLLRDNGSIVWADSVEGRFASIFELQSRVASALAQAVAVQLSAVDRASLAQQPTMNADALAAYWRGKALLERRDITDNVSAALAAFEEAIADDPRFADAHAARGEALWLQYVDTREPARARAALDAGITALRLAPNRAGVRYSLALTLKGSGELEQAAEELQRALALRPNFDDARRELGDVLARQGRIDEAVEEFRKAIALRPQYWAHHNVLGFTLLRAARYEEAVNAFQRVIALQPDNANAHQNLGAAYHYLGHYDEAVDSYERAVAIRPTPAAYSNLGAVYHERGQFDKAVRAYRASIALRPNAAATHRNLGDALRRLGRPAEAKQAYQEAVRLAEIDLSVNPKDPIAIASIAVYLAKAGDAAGARRRVREAGPLAPSNVEVQYRIAVAYALTGADDLALGALQRAVEGGYSLAAVLRDEDLASLRETPRFRALVASRP